MLFSNLGDGNILTLVERKARFLIGVKQWTKSADEVAQTIIDKLRSLPAIARRSITFDNGKSSPDRSHGRENQR